MPKTNEKNLRKLNRLLQAMDEDSLTRAEWKTEVKKMVDFLTSLRDKNQTEFKNLNQSIADLREKLKGENSKDLTLTKDEMNKIFGGLSDKLSGLVDDKIASMRDGIDGEDADEDRVSIIASERAIEAVKPLIPTLDDIRESLSKMGKAIRKAIDKKLLIKDIKGLQKELDELKKSRTIMTGGGGAGLGGHVRYKDLSASFDGATRTFSLPAFGRVLQVNLSSFPNILRETTDYTVNGSDFQITFTSEIPLNSISAGQTCIILYAEM